MAQLVSAPDCGSGGPGFESLYPPLQVVPAELIGLSPSGKAQDFDSCITLVRIQLAQYGILAQSVEHLTFNQGVGGSNPFEHILRKPVGQAPRMPVTWQYYGGYSAAG